MNRKQLTLLVVLGILIGGLGLALHYKKAASWQPTNPAMGQKVLKDFPLNEITAVRIKQPDAEINLTKEDQWTVKERWNYPANFSEVGDLLRKMWELKSVQTLAAGPSQYGRLELLSPEKEKGTNTATLLEFKDKSGKTIRSILLGKKATRSSEGSAGFGGDFPVGRYVAIPDNTQSVWLVSEAFADAEAKPDRWLNKDIFKVEKLRSISVTHTNATNSWKLVREKENGDLDLVDKKPGEEFDKNKAYNVANALSYPNFNDIANPAAKPEELGFDKGTSATLETFDDFVYNVKVAPATNDNYYLKMAVEGNFAKQRTPGKDEKPEDKDKLDKEFQEKFKKLDDKLKQEKTYEKWTYVLSKWTVDPLLKDRKDLLAEKKSDDKKPDAAKPGESTESKSESKPFEVNPFEVKADSGAPAPAPAPAEAKPDAQKGSTPTAAPKSNSPPPLPESKPEPK